MRLMIIFLAACTVETGVTLGEATVVVCDSTCLREVRV